MASGLGTDLDGSYLSDGLHAELHVTSEENLLTSGDNSHSISGQLDSSGTAGASADNSNEDAELEAIKARVREMEEEAEKLKEMQNEVEKQMNMTSPPSTPGATSTFLTFEEKGEVDSRSVYVGNVDYSATAEELEAHFHGCGSINRVTILCNKFTGHPKGYAYVEFSEKDAVKMAETLDESLFKGRPIKPLIGASLTDGVRCCKRLLPKEQIDLAFPVQTTLLGGGVGVDIEGASTISMEEEGVITDQEVVSDLEEPHGILPTDVNVQQLSLNRSSNHLVLYGIFTLQ
ncbi:Polyadenylate-binding protein 2 [Holothuria leucospilota]|uniref:Polyadenylate-binding protein 2 n=1 Tax=Holothuria leucospilota TaxID=206669 RepID=A0A9Q1CC61_HOLLE|nr:Polyadenylate-binding protein 2 [Holothuria leucospilota]